MTTDRDIAQGCICGGVLLAATLALALGCVGTSSVRQGDSIDVAGYPKDIQAAYQVFAVRCSRCHTLARPLNARIQDTDHWVRYVTRMRRNPSSGINPKDAEIILRFLLYYTQQVLTEEAGGGDAAELPTASGTGQAAGPTASEPPPASRSSNPAAPGSSMTEPASTKSDGGAP